MPQQKIGRKANNAATAVKALKRREREAKKEAIRKRAFSIHPNRRESLPVHAPTKEVERKLQRILKKHRYASTIPEGILPPVHPPLSIREERVPSRFDHFKDEIRPRRVVAGRAFFTEEKMVTPLPNLSAIQLESYRWFLTEGIAELLTEVSPITDFSGRKLELHFLGHTFDKPKYTPSVCRRNNLSFEAALKTNVQLMNRETGEIKQQDVFLGSIPLMTEQATFIINGIERVVVNQLVRSPGVFFRKMQECPKFHGAKIIPKRGVWLEVETDRRGVITCKIDRKRKIPTTQLLKIFGFTSEDAIRELFKDVLHPEQDFIAATLERDTSRTVEEAYQSIYRKVRPGDLATPENAKQLIQGMFFDFKKYDMGSIARHKMNRRFGLKLPDNEEHRVFQVQDFVEILKELIRLNSGSGTADDIDHLSNRRIRSVGELVQNKFRVGLTRTERIIKDRMTVMDLETITPMQLINCRPITASMREFFAGSQLSQFMDQTNPLSEIAHKRRLSAMGPGGLSRERASFDVRDVHTSHYGRICPIATPEGPNIGLVVHLAMHARVNSFGFIETPYQRVAHTVPPNPHSLLHRMAGETLKEGNHILIKEGGVIANKNLARKIITTYRKRGRREIPVRAHVTKTIDILDAEDERNLTIAQANSPINERGEFMHESVSARRNGEPILSPVHDITHIDVSPQQILSLTTSLIPFLEHDDNTRASMGTNMQRQATPLISPERPIVGTGVESTAARASRHIIIAKERGEVTYADAREMSVVYSSGEKITHSLRTFLRSNQGTCFHMRPRLRAGEKVQRGDILADGCAMDNGELSLGRNLLVAYMPWNGYNFEDSIIISDRLVREGFFDSVHIESYITDVRDTKLGPETVTRDIPNVGEGKLKDLDVDGIIRLGATVHEGDILVGKITPKGETELTAEERLLQAIFGDKAKDVKDSSLRLPGGAGGKVVDVQIFNRSEGDELPTGVIKQIKVFVAQTRKIQVGDKMAGRHGNKGVVSAVVPQEDLPFLANGMAVDIILNPLGVTSRMNIGQVFETHLGWACRELGLLIASPALNGLRDKEVRRFLEAANLPPDGKVQLYDGKTGHPFDHPTTVGVVYMMKLLHLVEDKIHARSVGPYSLVTQQPLGGKAQHGGQRFGEMEVWALEAYAAAHTLQEMLTIKSDDVSGRTRAYENIVKGEDLKKPSTPESFNVLMHELRALGLKPEPLRYYEQERAPITISTIPLETGTDDIQEEDRLSEMTVVSVPVAEATEEENGEGEEEERREGIERVTVDASDEEPSVP
jgi:DNA-directed RNA polymerase subunit beta